MQQWHTLEGSGIHAKTAGPFTRDAMEALARTGALTAATMVARVGATSWSAAGDDLELAAFFRDTPPQFPLFNSAVAAPKPYTFSNAFGLGWASFTAQWGVLVLIGFAYMVFAVAINIPLYIAIFTVQFGEWKPKAIAVLVVVAVLTWVVSIFVGTPLLASMLYAGVRAVRKEIRFEDLKAGFRRYGAVLGTGLLGAVLMIALAAIPYAIAISGVILTANASGSTGKFAIGVLLAIFGYASAIVIVLPAGIVWMLGVMSVVDPQVNAPGGMPALRLGYALAKNNLLSLSGLIFVLYLIMTFSIYACGVGFILLGLPLFFAGLGAAYELLRTQRSAAITLTGADG